MMFDFSNVADVTELKKLYRRYALQVHPDRGGTDADMAALNNAYDAAIARLTNSTAAAGDTTTESAADLAAYKAVIMALCHIPGIVIELCGRWIWISGDTKPVKDQLSAAGCHWAAKKLMWYWRPEDQQARHNRRTHSMDYIRGKYGSATIRPDTAPATT